MDAKKRFRKRALACLRRSAAICRYSHDNFIQRRLLDYILERKARKVMLYLPMRTEADISPVIKKLRGMGIEVYVPFMVGESFLLVKYRLPLQKKQFGIYEPKFSKQYRKRKIDLSIVPIVGTDPTLRRIGFGRGMYDRFFAREKKSIKEVVFVQRRLCFSTTVVTDHYDVMADCLIAIKGETVSIPKNV
jgi:5-formyltetrahydrofolate cyclo-ligase